MADEIQSNINININTSGALESIKQLQNQISAFHTQMAKMGAANAAQAANMRQNLINTINATGQFSANVVKIKTTTESFTEALEKNKLSLGEYFRYAGAASKSFGRFFSTEFDTINKVARERVKTLATQYIKLGRDANGAMQAIKVRPLMLDMESLGTKTAIAAQRQQLLNQLLKQGSTNLLNFGKNTQWAGRQLMVGFTVPLTIMAGAAMKSFAQMEESVIKFKRVYGDLKTSNAETEKMVKQVQQLALEYTKYGVAVSKTMDMAAQAAATGKQGADLLAQVNNANKLAVLGGVEQSKALETTISLTNAFGIAAKDLKTNIDFLNAVENQTVLNIEDMTTAIPKAAPVIQQLGGNVKDLAFFLTAMKEGGINASEGANAIKSGLASLINPTAKASSMLQGFGINIKGIVEKDKGDLKKTVVDFAKALDTLDPLNRARAIEQLFGKFQFARMSTLFQNVVAQGSQAAEVLKLANESSLQLSMLSQKELNKIQSSPLYKFQKSVADFQAQLAPIGEQFMKAVTPIIEFGTNIMKQFNGLGDGVKQFIVKTVAVAGVIGPVLLMSFGLIANAVANVIKGFALVKDLFNKTGKSSLTLGEQVRYMTTQQLDAAAVAASLDQTHSKLKQTFSLEAEAVNNLTLAYRNAVAAQQALNVPITPRGVVPPRKFASGGFITGPGTGTSDSILARVSNGEAIIPAASVARHPELVHQLVTGNIPGFRRGRDGDVPTYGEYGLRLQDALENQSKSASTISNPSQILSFASMRIGESLGIKPTQSSVSKGLFDPIYKKYEDVFTKFTNKINLEFETTFASIKNTDERMRLARESAAKFVEKEALQLATTEAEKLAVSRSLGLTEDFYGSMPTMPRRAGGKYLERARKSIYSLGSTGIRGYLSLGGATRRMYERMTGESAQGFQLGHFNQPQYVSMQEIAQQENLSNASKKALQSVGVKIVQQAEESVVSGMTKEGDMRSPSRKTEEKGKQLVQGTVKGLESGVDEAKAAGQKLAAATTSGVSQSTIASRGRGRRVTREEVNNLSGNPAGITVYDFGNDVAQTNLAPNYLTEQEKRLAEQAKIARQQEIASYGRFGRVGSRIASLNPRVVQGSLMGASIATSMGSMIPGPIGEISGQLSMPLMIAGMIPNLSRVLGAATMAFGRFIPVLGAALLAWEAWDKIAVPLIKKNADTFEAISKTLSITQDRLDKINNFFGTEIKLTGIRGMVTASGDQTKKEATIAQQFQQSQEFKDTYQANAQQLKNLTDTQFKIAMQAMATDLFGQGMAKEQVTAIIDAIALEAQKSRVSIAPELFSLKNSETRALMNKNIQSIFAETNKNMKNFTAQIQLGGGFDATGTIFDAATGKFDNWLVKPLMLDPETIAKVKASSAEIGSYMSALSSQYQSGIISAKEFSIQYDQLIAVSQKMPGTAGIELLKSALIGLNSEIGNAIQGLSNSQFTDVSKAIVAGVIPTQESLNFLQYGTEKQKEQQSQMFKDAYSQLIKQNKTKAEYQKTLTGIQQQTQKLDKLEQGINDKYDKRIAQIEKIKTLNDQINKQQQGQIDLAEALNRGDIGAAARAAQNLQQTQIDNALEQQKTALQDARQAELKPLQNQSDANTNAVTGLTNKIQDLIEKGITVKTPGGTVPTKPTAVEQTPDWMRNIFQNPLYEFFSLLGITAATGGHIKGPGTGTSDSIPAMLSNGEYVIRANAVKTIGVDTLDKLNQADKMKFANGGIVGYKDGGNVDNAMANRWMAMGRAFKNGYTGRPQPQDPGGWDAQGMWHPSSYFKQIEAFRKKRDADEAEQKRLGNPSGEDIMNVAKNMAYFYPLIGSTMMGLDATDSASKGDWGGAAFNAAGALASLWMPGAFKLLGMGIMGIKKVPWLDKALSVAGSGIVSGISALWSGTKAIGVGAKNAAVKVGTGIKTGSKNISDVIKTARAIKSSKNILAAISEDKATAAQMSKLTPTVGFNMNQEALLKFLAQNEYKTIHSGVRSSTTDTIGQRLLIEEAMLGINRNSSLADRPTYGFLTSHEPVPHTMGTTYPGVDASTPYSQVMRDAAMKMINPTGTARMYGNYTVLTKPSVLARGKYSFGDTLSIYTAFKKLGLRIPKNSKLSSFFNTKTGLGTELDFIEQNVRKARKDMRNPYYKSPYVEVQVPGGFNVSEVEKILFNPDTMARSPEQIAEEVKVLQDRLNELDLQHIQIEVSSGKNLVNQLMLKHGVTNSGQLTNRGLIGISKPQSKFASTKLFLKSLMGNKTKGLTQSQNAKLNTLIEKAKTGNLTESEYAILLKYNKLPKNFLGNLASQKGPRVPLSLVRQKRQEAKDWENRVKEAFGEEYFKDSPASEIARLGSRVIRHSLSPTELPVPSIFGHNPLSLSSNSHINPESHGLFDINLLSPEQIKGLAKSFVKDKSGNWVIDPNTDWWLSRGSTLGYFPNMFNTLVSSRAAVVHTNPIIDFLWRSGLIKTPTGLQSLFNLQKTLKNTDSLMPQIGFLPQLIYGNKSPWSGFASGIGSLRNLQNTKSMGNDFQNMIFGKTKYFKDINVFGPLSTYISSITARLSEGVFPHEQKHIFDVVNIMKNRVKEDELTASIRNARHEASARIQEEAVALQLGKTGSLKTYSPSTIEGLLQMISRVKKGERRHQLNADWYKEYINTIEQHMTKNNSTIHTPEDMAGLKDVQEFLQKYGMSYEKMQETNTTTGTQMLALMQKRINQALPFVSYQEKAQLLRYSKMIDALKYQSTKSKNILQKLFGQGDKNHDLYPLLKSIIPQFAQNRGRFVTGMTESGAMGAGGKSLVEPSPPLGSLLDILGKFRSEVVGSDWIEKGKIQYKDELLSQYENIRSLHSDGYYSEANKQAWALLDQLEFLYKKAPPFPGSRRITPEQVSEYIMAYDDAAYAWKKAGKGKEFWQGEYEKPIDLLDDNPELIPLIPKFALGGLIRKYALGGMVSPINYTKNGLTYPKFFANGGFAMGTDTVPAMLTPGEFVIKKSAVDRIGTDTLNKINGYADGGLVGGSQTIGGDSVYNYSINVNVSSQSDPNQIARAVMTQIKQIDNHRIRGNSF
jgi:TP901 family phage tail tape measure protein